MTVLRRAAVPAGRCPFVMLLPGAKPASHVRGAQLSGAEDSADRGPGNEAVLGESGTKHYTQ